MPFAYKLAYRLARLKHRTLAGAAAAVAAAVVLSCELPVQVATPNAPVSQLIIIPHTVTLQLNQDQDFVAVGLSAAGDTTPSTVSWNVTGGTITDMGASNGRQDRKSTRLNSSHGYISYAVFCLKKKKTAEDREI